MEEEDSKRTLSYHQDVSTTSNQFNNNNNKSVPQQILPAAAPAESLPGSSTESANSNYSLPTVSGTVAQIGLRVPYSQDSSELPTEMDVTVLQPPSQMTAVSFLSGSTAGNTGGGKPLHIKRGPGRPRKDGVSKSPKPVMSQKLKKLTGWPTGSAGRGIRGRKKTDERSFVVGGTNNSYATLGDLNLFGISDSPPRLTGADDTAESDSSSVASSLEKLHEDFPLFSEQWPGKLCALCNLGERSMLGQGDLKRIDIPNGFDAQVVSQNLASSRTEKDNSSDRTSNFASLQRRQKGLKIKRLMSQGSMESMSDPIDEIVGHTDEPELNSIFDSSSGHYYVHNNCALWCNGVSKTEDGKFEDLEKEIVRAASQSCGHCQNFGAATVCAAPNCGVALHVPCVAGGGGFQDFSSKATLCSEHIHLAPDLCMLGKAANCTVCDLPGSTSSLLMCCSCYNHYHVACLDLNSSSITRAGWQCLACKVCQACRQPGEDTKLVTCDACDKVYHIFCLRPALTACPKYSWKCKMCRKCNDCGARTPGSGPSSRWHQNFSVCDSCYQQRNKGLACPVCGKAYRHVSQKHMVQCHQCKKYVHDSCDQSADLSVYQTKKEANPDYQYVCSVCLTAPNGNSSNHPRVLLSIKRSAEKDEFSSESNSLCNSFTSCQDSFLSAEDDSLAAGDYKNQSWGDKSVTQQPSGNCVDDRFQSSTPRGKPLSVHFRGKKLGSGRPKNLDKHGLGNSSKRQRLNDLQRKRGPKPKFRGVFGVPGVGLQRPCVDLTQKSEEEPGVENRLILCSSRDEFVLQQDVCVMCGAFGNDLEGRLISCAQCGQCYHPFCVNVKVTKVILQKGWRCLDCTVCEGCGSRHDEARLILCDDCDVSFHIYCMDPPLDHVPVGTWKCKWCVVCHLCGTNIPGLNSTWYNNYTLCGPCYSLNTCSVCTTEYIEGDLTIQCTRCDRWLHATCDKINNENEAEQCAEDGYTCISCRPDGALPPHLRPPPPPIVKVPTPPRSPEVKGKPVQQFLMDGVPLTESGISHMKSLSLDQPKKKRKKVMISEREAGILAAIESVVSGTDAKPEPDPCEGMSEKDKELAKKKQRHLQKLGIGGFQVRNRVPRYKDDDDPIAENQISVDGEKPKRKTARKIKPKNKIVESFPSYLQEAFFGKLPQISSSDADFVNTEEVESVVTPKISKYSTVLLNAEELRALNGSKDLRVGTEKVKAGEDERVPELPSLNVAPNEVSKQHLKHQVKIEEEDDALDILPIHLLDNEIVNTIMNDGDDIKVPDSLDDLADSALGDDADLNLDPNSGDGGNKDDINDVFSNFQFSLDNIETGLPSMDSKDVEDIFKVVLTDESQESQDNLFPMTVSSHTASSQISGTSAQSLPGSSAHVIGHQNNLNSPLLANSGIPVANVSNRSQLQQSVQQGLASPINFPPPSPYHSEYSNSPQFSPAFSEPPSPWPTQGDSEQEAPSNYSQRSILKWEVDEALGLQATISAVLYANTNHPELKRDYPNWNERSKQIAKIWRSLSTEKRAPYLQKARENRAASRMQKSQQEQDKLGSSALSKQNTIRGETAEERQWKQMQALRQQQQQQQQLVLQEHRLQGDQAKDPSNPNKVSTSISPGSKLQYTAVMSPSPRQSLGDAQAGAPAEAVQRQPLQVSTASEMNMPAPQSPLLQSPTSRQLFSVVHPGNRPRLSSLDMPPPSPGPHFQNRPPMGPQAPQAVRSTMYSHPRPFVQPVRNSLPSPHDPYANSPMTPQSTTDPYSMPPSTPRPEVDQFASGTSESFNKLLPDGYNGANSELDNNNLASPRTPAPQAQEARQHLRDLLQRQQMKKLENEQLSPVCDTSSTPRPMSWGSDDWQRQPSLEQPSSQNYSPRHPGSSPNSPQLPQQNQFRQPLLPTHGRIPSQPQISQSASRAEFRPGAPQSPGLQGMDPRSRLMMQQQHQQRLVSPGQSIPARSQINFSLAHPSNQMQGMTQMQHQSMQHQQMQQINPASQFRQSMQQRESIDPYDHLVHTSRTGATENTAAGTPSMLAQQLGRPLNNQHQINATSASMQHQNQASVLSPSRVTGANLAHNVLAGSSDHHELPESVTAELEKLEQEQHNDASVEADGGELGDMVLDDDDLLGMGADFNILEYADPELDQAGVGEKTNILDNLDLEEEKDEEKDDKDPKRKELEKSEKREPSVSGFSTIPSSTGGGIVKVEVGQIAQNNVGSTGTPSHFSHNASGPVTQGAGISGKPSLRPPQPPPPYPVPPPPYPGRPQIGIRNGGGISMQSMPSVVNVGNGVKNQMGMVGNLGLRQSAHHLHSPGLNIPYNPVMPQQHRRTLLLQEQPLLLEDLLEQEKREQQRQGPNLIGSALEEPLLSDYDFERLKADVMSTSALPVSISPPTVHGQMALPPPQQPGKFGRSLPHQMNQATGTQWQNEQPEIGRASVAGIGDPGTIPMHPALAQSNSAISQASTTRIPSFPLQPAPPTPPEHPANEQERQMQLTYEKWLHHQHQALDMQLKFYETEVNKLRKGKKSLNSKLRQLKKNGNELNETDAAELERIIRELASLQKGLDQSRKQNRQHASLTQDYRTKQQKRQQLMGMVTSNNQGPPQGHSQLSPLGTASQSPMHSTPQSPILSPSPSLGGPVPSPLTQHHSPMASPLTPSPGPSGGALSQTSPRNSLGSMHHMDDRPFSPGSDNTMRSMASPTNNMQGRMGGQGHLRMQNPVQAGPGNISQPGSPMLSGNPNQNIMTPRGMMNVGHHQQRPMYMDAQRMRGGNPEQLRLMGPNPPRYQRALSQEMMMRARSHQNQYQNMSSPQTNQHYQNPQRVPFPNQSPTGPTGMSMGMIPNLRSPLPLNSMGGLNSPPGAQGLMTQNRVSPASSPMRRPSGSGSVGVASPIPDRPQSVENPLTPRSAGSGPHTPSSLSGSTGLSSQGMDTMGVQLVGHDGTHYHGLENSVLPENGNTSHMSNYGMFPLGQGNVGSQQHSDYSSGGGGGSNPQILPFPTFSWFDGPVRLGLRGGSPFSVVNGSPTSHSSTVLPEQNQNAAEQTASDSNVGSLNRDHTESSNVPEADPLNPDIPSLSTPQSQGNSLGVNAILVKTEISEEGHAQELTEKQTPYGTTVGMTSSNNSVPAVVIKTEPSDNEPHSAGPALHQLNHNLVAGDNDHVSTERDTASFSLNVDSLDSAESVIPANTSARVSQAVASTTSAVALSDTSSLLQCPTVPQIPPSSIYQANVGVLGGYRPIQTIVSQISEAATHQTPTATAATAVLGTSQNSVSLASTYVSDTVSIATLSSVVTATVSQETVGNPSVPLITVYSRPEMKAATAITQSNNLTTVLLTPRSTATVAGQQEPSPRSTQANESQNALLKQLLQNTGCASMNQAPTDSAGFSLSGFSKPKVPLHASALSEAASRIPQPTPTVVKPPVSQASVVTSELRTDEGVATTSASSVQLPEIMESDPSPAVVPPSMTPTPIPSSPKIEEVSKVDEVQHVKTEPIKDTTNSSSITDVIDVVASDKNSVETKIPEKKVEIEETKKAKKRQYQPKKRQSAPKEATTPKKRQRKGSKLEEDYDTFMENILTQIRQLPAVNIAEPELCRNYNVCPLAGAGDYTKISHVGYDLHSGDLVGSFGNASLSGETDYYTSRPFGVTTPKLAPNSPTSSRGFYNQEFAAPKISRNQGNIFEDDCRSPTPFRDSETPDTILSASSPELGIEMADYFPGLKLIEDDEDERRKYLRDSPTIPIFTPIPIRPALVDQVPKPQKDELDKENSGSQGQGPFILRAKASGIPSPLKETGNVTVTLTLSSTAAEDIRGLLTNLASVLSIATPVYQVVERTASSPSQKLGLNTYKGKDGREIVDIQGILNGAAKFCRMCDVVLITSIIKKKVRDLPGLSAEDPVDDTDELYFCSTLCFMKFTVTHNVTLPSEEKAGAVVKHPSEGCEGIDNTEKSKLPLRDSSRLTLSDTDSIKSLNDFLSSNDSGVESLSSESRDGKTKRGLPEEVRIKQENEPPCKKWKGIRYRKWSNSLIHLSKHKKPTEKETTEMLFRMKITVTPGRMPDDRRKCMFCKQQGDGISDGPARLLNYDVDKWVHLNCALWSEEVYETENGALVNVELALKQSLILHCVICKTKGATVKCFKTRCSSAYHLGCAVKDGCTFYKNKTIFCPAHTPKGEKDNELTTLAVHRRVYIQRDENRQVAAVMHHADQQHLLRVGSLIFLNVGQLLPHQLQNFHTVNFIYPIGYKIVRFYWSMRRSNKRCQYVCSIHEVDGKPEFRISPQEEGCQDMIIRSATAQGAWHQVLDSVGKIRCHASIIKVFPKYITGEDLFGLTEPAIVKVLESLPGIETLSDYHFKYGRNPLLELPLAINPTGCARSEPKLRTLVKRPHTQRTGTCPRSVSSLTSSVFSSSEAVCPYSKQFVHSKSSQYKKMKQEWRNNVFLARSKIQGLGLYAARDIERHTMVIEYIGEIIRSELAELREKKYESQNRGIYMFRVDEDRVIDATLCGGLARYINHSCNPNCVAETVEVDREWRIIIFANRRISRGEELAYDYKFEFEDDQHKIQCFCGAPNCRQWMN